jgi:hypothetical protein
VGGEEDSEQGCYAFRLGNGATTRTGQMCLGSWNQSNGLSPHASAVEAWDGIVEEVICSSR